MKLRCVLLALCFGFFVSYPVQAQEASEDADQAFEEFMKKSELEVGPLTGRMSKVAEINTPEGYMFSGPKGTQYLMELMGNPVDGSEIGFVSPDNYFESDDGWFLVFEFNEVGYVKDDEKDSLDADAMLKSIRDNEQSSNDYRQAQGYSTLHVQRWAVSPNYNSETQNLEWALEFEVRPEMDRIVNHNIKILGRNGYVQATLVCGPEQLQSVLPEAREILRGFTYQSGQKYAEYRKGDKIAEYGLTGLVVGGGLALAAKSGLLGRLLKPLIIGVLAFGAFIKKIFTGKNGR